MVMRFLFMDILLNIGDIILNKKEKRFFVKDVFLEFLWPTMVKFCIRWLDIRQNFLFWNNLIDRIIIVKYWLPILMAESYLINQCVVFMLIFLFGMFFGVIFGMSKKNKKRNIWMFLFLIQILYYMGLSNILLKPTIHQDSSRLLLKTIPEINEPLLKLIMQNPIINNQIPLLMDPLFLIEDQFIYEESINYKIELFQFYKSLDTSITINS